MKRKEDTQTILVLDFGAQYAQLIARRVRECKVYSEIVPYDISVSEIKARKPKGLILSGGPSSVYAEESLFCDKAIFELGIPVLGICYGMQLMAHYLGGEVAHTGKSEYGKTELTVFPEGLLFEELPLTQTVWMSHRDSVKIPPEGFRPSAQTSSTPVAAMDDVERKLFGVQFHPEVIHTPLGMDILKNFLYRACDCLPTWTTVSIIDEAVERVKNTVGSKKVICGLSGGIDSSVAALLVHRAVGDKLTCVFVDHGLLRKGEAEQVEDTFREHFHINLIHVKAEERFLRKLDGVTDPEKKRMIIGEEFIRTFEKEASRLKDVEFLVQGTLYPDVIESGTRQAARIKSHHNVGGLPVEMDLKIVEPLRSLFKDEVRALGEELGLSEEIVWRQPFPGPGLAIRIVGEVTEERLEILREADAIVIDEVRRAGLYKKLWQSFAILLCIRSVGVMGDKRTYAYPIVLRAVMSEDAMTADWARLPDEVLERISSRIINEVPGVNRVVYDISSKPPSTIEWE
jgi:GMP synthase (glutamine-hydrolysing)